MKNKLKSTWSSAQFVEFELVIIMNDEVSNFALRAPVDSRIDFTG